MKKLILFVLAVMLAGFTFAQKINESDVPPAVKSKFTASFKDAQSVKWSKEKNNYEAEFKLNKVEMSCNISLLGDLLETETEIAVTELPADIKADIEKTYPGSKINEAAKIDTKGVITYEAEVKIGKDNYDLIYDVKGTFIKKEKSEEED